jgi:hypothetical protein
MNKQEIIQQTIDKIKGRLYLEIGVQRGKNFYKIRALRKIAIDPKFIIGYKRRLFNFLALLNSTFFEMTSNQFFEKKAGSILAKKKIDVAFIDGLHTYEQSLTDFNNCLKYLAPNGVILFHDCNPQSREAAEPVSSPQEMMNKFQRKNSEWNGDVWKTIVHLRTFHPDLKVFVLDCDFGIGIVTKGIPDIVLSYTQEQINKMEYDYFDKNRTELLNLKSPSYLNGFINSL